MKKLDLGKENINKLIISFSIPCIISMLINSVYNIVDQIFIGRGVGTIGNAATNVIFPIVIICNAIAGLIGDGCAANLSLRLGEGNIDDAKKSVSSSTVLLIIISIIVALLGEVFLDKLVIWFGCTENIYESAITYGRIILLGAPFMIFYSGLSSVIRSDGSPGYSMACLVVGAIINLILDPIFIFGLHLGVAGGAFATIIGQFVSFLIAIMYLRKIKTVDLKLKDYKLNKSIFKTLSLGTSSFITQMTVLALFVVMNNIMTKYGAKSSFGSDIPLSVYGVISKLNSLYVASILGISIGSQPIIGFNFGAGNYERVKETLKKVLLIGFIIGILFNIMFFFFPKEIISLFIKKNDPNYKQFMNFAVDFSRIFLMVCFLNAFEMCSSIVIQSLGNVKKATLVSFTRQIILFIPISIVLCHFIGLYGALYAGPIADSICFVVVAFVFTSEYRKLASNSIVDVKNSDVKDKINPLTNYVITIAREYGSGGRYVGKLLSEKLGISYYDKELISVAAEKSGLKEDYIENIEEKKESYYGNENLVFIAECNAIKEISKNPCVIIGRCGNYVLRDKKNTFNIFLYSDMNSKIKRVTTYYGISHEKAKSTINKINKERAKNYKFYTGLEWQDNKNYDICINVDVLGVEKTAETLKDIIINKDK